MNDQLVSYPYAMTVQVEGGGWGHECPTCGAVYVEQGKRKDFETPGTDAIFAHQRNAHPETVGALFGGPFGG
jgi:dihydroxyacetone kinase